MAKTYRLLCRDRALAVLMAAALLSVAFNACGRKGAPENWDAILKPIQEKYAPDIRLSVFTIKMRTEESRLTAEGTVESPSAKDEILRRAAEVSRLPVTDKIRVLPDPALAPNDRGIVIVSVGNVRRGPGHPEELVTQVLLGDTLRLLENKGGWYHVRCPDGYLGWIDGDAILRLDSAEVDRWIAARRLIVTSHYDLLRSGPAASAAAVCDLVAGDILRLVAERGAWLETALPDGRTGFVERAAVTRYEVWQGSRKLTAETIEATARSFMGVPYLWGGTSPKGFDCSGFVKTVFALNGRLLERDADQQARQGTEVDAGIGFGSLCRGDLLFFGRKATAEKPERIVHVGIYLADRQFIHCSGRVRVSSLDPNSPDYDEWHVKRFLHARRLVVR